MHRLACCCTGGLSGGLKDSARRPFQGPIRPPHRQLEAVWGRGGRRHLPGTIDPAGSPSRRGPSGSPSGRPYALHTSLHRMQTTTRTQAYPTDTQAWIHGH